MRRAVRWFPLVTILVGCGGATWTASDTKGATNAVLTERTALWLCADDGGPCRPSQVRALEQAALCVNASMLSRHGLAVPGDAGGGCGP